MPSSVSEDESLLCKWSFDVRCGSDRRKLYNILFQAPSFARYVDRLNVIRDTDLLALALNDSPEAYRKQALQQLRASKPDVYERLEKRLSHLQEVVYKNGLDPGLLFPRVATSSFMAILPVEAQHCFDCKKGFDQFSDII